MINHCGKISAVDNLSLRIDQGGLFGLPDPNGAGIATTVWISIKLTGERIE